MDTGTYRFWLRQTVGVTVIDAWMQHPTLRMLRHDMFESLCRWTGYVVPDDEIPVSATVDLMDESGVDRGLI